MPRPPKDLGSYEKWLFDVVAAAQRQQAVPPIPAPDRKAAITMRHQWGRFRVALARERHPGFEHALDLICRISNLGRAGMPGSYYLEFVPKGLVILADESRGSRRGMPSPLRDELPGLDELLAKEDPGEEYFKAYIGEPKPKGETK